MTDYDNNRNNNDALDVWSDFDRFFADNFAQMNHRLEVVGEEAVKIAPDGPDGIPHVQEFGNSAGDQGLLAGSPAERIREPLTDVTQDGNQVRATAEIPGVNKSDIELDSSPTSLTITVDTPRHKFCKTLALPCDVDPDSAKAEYNNGILEVTMTALKPAEVKKRIKVQ